MMLKRICHHSLYSSNRLLRAFIFRVSPSPYEHQRAANTLERVYYSTRYVDQAPRLRFALQRRILGFSDAGVGARITAATQDQDTIESRIAQCPNADAFTY